jgi:hypothetical protein
MTPAVSRVNADRVSKWLAASVLTVVVVCGCLGMVAWRVVSTTHGGELVAAVGVPAERDCLVAVRRVDGTIAYPGYDRIWLEPGEVGCRVSLYTAPPR